MYLNINIYHIFPELGTLYSIHFWVTRTSAAVNYPTFAGHGSESSTVVSRRDEDCCKLGLQIRGYSL